MAKNASPEQELRNSIDDKIKELEDQIRTLREQRNSLAPIARLPTELLSNIFLYVRGNSSGTALVLPSASHVCRAWREIALSCATLWTNIDCRHARWAEVQLARSSTTPVRLMVHEMPSDVFSMAAAAVQFAVRTLPRADVFYIDCYSPLMGTSDETLQVWPSGALLLGRLRVHSLMFWRLPAEFMRGAFPKLKVVDLRNCLFNWEPSSFFSGLTELRIDFSTSWAEIWNPRLQDILRTLRDMNDLKILELLMDNTRENHGRTAIDASNLFQVSLPSLSILVLGLHASTTIALLDHLSHPQERLEVSCYLEHEQDVRVLSRHLGAFRSYMLQCGYTMDAAYLWRLGHQWGLRLCDPAGVRDPTEDTEQWHLRVFLDILDSARPACPAIWRTCLSPLNCFTFDQVNVYMSVREYLSHCTALCVWSRSVDSSYDLLSSEMLCQPNGVSWLPNLRVLVVCGADFSKIPETTESTHRITTAKYRARLEDILPFVGQVKFLDCRSSSDKLLGLSEDVRPHVSHMEGSLTQYQAMKLALEVIES